MSAVSTEINMPGVQFLPKPFEPEHLLSAIASAIASYDRSARAGSSSWSTPR
jgi:FixJ family two-component response regulator